MAATVMHLQGSPSLLVEYETQGSAELAVDSYQRVGLDVRHLSLLARDHGVGRHSGDSGASTRVAHLSRGSWDSLASRMSASAQVLVSGIGCLILMGPLVGSVKQTLEGNVWGGAAGMLRATLTGIGVANGSIVRYGLALKAGCVLVRVHGPEEVVRSARTVFAACGSRPVAGMSDERPRALNDVV